MPTYGAIKDPRWRFTMDRVNDKSQAAIKNPGAYLKRALEGKYAGGSDPALAPAAAQPQEDGSLEQIRAAFIQARNDEAAGMFKEMPEINREPLVVEYNETRDSQAAKLPPTPSARKPRHLIPFYSWLAKKYWGEPTAQDLFDYGLKTGAISLKQG